MNKIICVLSIVLMMPLFSFASDCDVILGDTLASTEPAIWNIHRGWSNRGALGNRPKRSPETEVMAGQQGVFYWGQSIAVAKSIEEARKHDFEHKSKNTGKFPYLITDIDVSDLVAFTEATHPELSKEQLAAAKVELDLRARARLKQILASDVKIIEFDDAQMPNGDKIPAENYRELDKQQLINLGVLDEIVWLDVDTRGPRFHFFGWSFPKLRGVLVFDDILKRNNQGAIANAGIRKMFRNLIQFLQEGGTIRFNGDFREALTMAKNQFRAGPGGKMVQNSTFKNDPSAEKAAMELYERGDAISVEARNKAGELVAGEILIKSGNVIHPKTIFHWIKGQDLLNPNRNYADIAKAVSIAEALRFGRLGIPWVDIGMLSSLSEEEGGKIISGVEFEIMFVELNAKPAVDLEFDKPFSLSELPFSMEEMPIWVPAAQPPPPPRKKAPPRTPKPRDGKIPAKRGVKTS
jgi:hypothetical protein